MKDFAKLYRAEDTGQVLVTIERGDDGPVVRIAARMPNVGWVSVNLGFADSELGWELAEGAFDGLDEAKSMALAREQLLKGPFSSLARA